MYVSDDKICFSLQGLRWIKKSKHNIMKGGKDWFTLELQYKGSQTSVRYDTAEERDAVYDLAVKHLTRKDKRYKTETLEQETTKV